MFKKIFLFVLTFSNLAAMQRPTGTPAQQAAARLKAQIDHEFKAQLVETLKEVRPFSLLSKLKNFYDQNRSVLPTMHEMCASFMLTLKYPMAALGSKITDLQPSNVEQAWEKEWALAMFESKLQSSGTTLEFLKSKLKQEQKRFESVPVEQQAFYDVERDLQTKNRLLNKAQKIFAARDTLTQLQENPLTLFKNQRFQKEYNDTLRELYSPQTIDLDAQDQHAEGHTLLFQLCHQNLPINEFSQMLKFLISGEQGLGINYLVADKTLLDYAKQIKLDQEYINIIVTCGGKKAPKKGQTLRWSDDIPEHK